MKPVTQKIFNSYMDDAADFRDKTRSSFHKNVTCRIRFFMGAPIGFATTLVDTIIGVGSGLANVATLGLSKKLARFSFIHIDNSRCIFSMPFVSLLVGVNYKYNERVHSKPRIKPDGDGLLTDSVKQKFDAWIDHCAKSDNVLKRHVISRLSCVLEVLACAVTRAVDGVIGVVTASAALITLGRFNSLNNCAFRGLQFTGVIFDLFQCAHRFLHPRER